MCSSMCGIRGLSMVRTIGIYIRTYRTYLLLLSIVVHRIYTLTASYAASICDTTNNIVCGNGGHHVCDIQYHIRIPHDIPWL
nr:MAG TPA: hypothetical protein [Caudoviricetes sp.]